MRNMILTAIIMVLCIVMYGQQRVQVIKPFAEEKLSQIDPPKQINIIARQQIITKNALKSPVAPTLLTKQYHAIKQENN